MDEPFLAVQQANDVAGMRMAGSLIARRLTLHQDDFAVDSGSS
jgi:hypothetical protein